jgi:serine/threonine-protein kinase
MHDPEHLRRLNVLLEEALSLPVAERAAWLAARPDGDRVFLPELSQLLARAQMETDDFMGRPASAALDALAAAEARPDEAGDLIGPYRLIELLGEGGMATVWRAERADGGLAREVALKLPRLGFSAGLAQRMARERDLLAALEHPNIARLYDAGVSEGGRPWLAMERVTGVPIDEYVRLHAVQPVDVLRLILQVCDALAHAHARLIVHRDLKPANLLVTEDAQVRLLDFGVGKLLQGEHDSPPASWQLTQLIGGAMTPDYASPEQISRKPLTVATDVYSLGVVLYELLSGQRPYRLGRRSSAALEEAILTADVKPASRRCADPARARLLRGDLDAVLSKALAKSPTRRYTSVHDLAADLRAYLDGRPVTAQTPSRRYRLARFARRRAWPLAAGAGVALSLLIGLGAALWQGHVARLEAQRADQARQFITGLLGEAQPREGSATAGAVSSADLLVRAGERIEAELSGDPRLAAELGILVAERLANLGHGERGRAALRRATDRAVSTLGPRHPLAVKGRALLTSSLLVLEPVEAHRMADALVPDALAGLPATAKDAVWALRSQSFILAKANQAEASIRVLKQAVAVAEEHLGAEHEQTLISLGLLANTHGRFRQFDAQLAVANEAMLRAQSALGAARPNTTLTVVERWYAEALRRNDRPADAIPIHRRTVQDQRALDGADTHRVRNMLYQLGLALGEAGQLGEGIETLRLATAMEAEQNPSFNEDRVNYRRSLMVLLGFARRGAEVEVAANELEDLMRLALAANPVASPYHGLGSASAASSSASPTSAASAAGGTPVAAPLTAGQILASTRAARVMAYRGFFDLAQTELTGRLEAVQALKQPEPGLRSEVWHALTLVAKLQGNHALALQRAQNGWDDAARPQARAATQAALASEWAAALFELGDLARAAEVNREALALWERAQVQPSPLSATAVLTQARLHLRAGQPAQALALLEPLARSWAESHPGSEWQAETLHWRSVALHQMGNREQAKADAAAATPLLRASKVPVLRRLAAR